MLTVCSMQFNSVRSPVVEYLSNAKMCCTLSHSERRIRVHRVIELILMVPYSREHSTG